MFCFYGWFGLEISQQFTLCQADKLLLGIKTQRKTPFILQSFLTHIAPKSSLHCPREKGTLMLLGSCISLCNDMLQHMHFLLINLFYQTGSILCVQCPFDMCLDNSGPALNNKCITKLSLFFSYYLVHTQR